MSLRVKYRNETEFSPYRFVIPEVCDHQGRAIYLDSDMICLADIGELFDAPMGGCDFLGKEGASGPGRWALSLLLIDGSRCRFDLEAMAGDVDRRLY